MDRTNAIEKLYSESLEYLFKQDSTAGMTCSSDSHLAIVYTTFLRHAQRHVYIFHGSMSILNNKDVTREAQRAIERGVEIKCLNSGEFQETTFEKLLPKGNFKAEPAHKPFCFVVMDDKALYWNSDNRLSTRVYVNNRKIAKILETHFKQVWSK